jgi:DNA-binding NarL/FixJ family response regulator
MSVMVTLNEVTAPLSAAHAKPVLDSKSVGNCLKDLTDQQIEVSLLLSEGHSNKIIAHTMKRSQATVKAHLSAILRVLGCTNRTQAALLIYQWRVANRNDEGVSVSRNSGTKSA